MSRNDGELSQVVQLQSVFDLGARVTMELSAALATLLADIPDFYNRIIPRRGVETTCVEEVRRYDVSEYCKELV